MFNRLRHLEISLAKKCQLLFGAAIALIIAAALFVPWQRMEQLMEQLNENAAEILVRQTVDQHVAQYQGMAGPYRVGAMPATLPPATKPVVAGNRTFQPPRLLLVAGELDSDRLTRFERSALRYLRNRPGRMSVARLGEDNTRYRYVRIESSCLTCHVPESTLVSAVSPEPTTQPITQPTTQASDRPTSRPVADAPPDESALPSAAVATAGEAAAPTTAPADAPADGLQGVISVDIPTQITPNQSLLNRSVLLLAGMLAGTLAILSFWLITSRLFLQPVRVLQKTAEKVSQGDLGIRADINTGDEFQVLSETFNTMLANLKRSTDQLRAVNKSLDLKLGQLAESNVALYESNRLKSEFLANVSHELRTPLNSILGFAELLKDHVAAAGPDGKPSDGKPSRYLQNILRSGNNLLDLINDLLDLAKIEAGRMEVRSEPLSLSDLFEALAGLLKPLCAAKDVTIDPQVSSEVPILQTDTAKLQQILYNFLSNAIKYSPEGETILLSAMRQDDEGVKIAVTDRGPGIDTEKQGLIFEKFRQIDGSMTRQHSGTGLGLAISKELAQLLGGHIGVESKPGEGSTFWITLPLRIEAGSQDVRGRLVLS